MKQLFKDLGSIAWSAIDYFLKPIWDELIARGRKSIAVAVMFQIGLYLGFLWGLMI